MRPKPPISGVIYGEIAYWIAIIGMVIGIVGLAIYLSSGGVMSPDMISDLLSGKNSTVLWEKHSIVRKMPESPHWYVNYIDRGDAIAMLGIVICGMSAIVAMWATTVTLFVKREVKIFYGIFALVVSIIMSLAAIGIISLHH